ncbi:MAG: hypothetical protein HY903_25285 [Deltaproteobacteria bacterium]|nr:hypothetical protein [Deltaproteobacteria bacterium]
MSLDELKRALPEQAHRHLDPATPMPMRMMAAKGLAPLPPTEMVVLLCALTFDPDDKLGVAAKGTLTKLPDKVLGPALDAELPTAALGVIAPLMAGRDAVMEKIVLNRRTPDEVLAAVAPLVSQNIGEILSNNQERLLRSEALVRAVAVNPNILKSSLDRVFDFLVRAGVVYADMPAFGEAIARLSPAEMQQAADKVALPEEVVKALIETDDAKPGAAPAADVDTAAPSLEEQAQRVPVLQLIAGLNPAQRIALALRGNREARTILVRDPNRVVAAAAIRSPRLTEQEVISAAQSRSVCDEVIRVIANTKEMIRPYGVKLALVNNPKTPVQTAMHLLTLLRGNDLKAVAKSRNVNNAVATHAKRLVNAKGGG